MKNKLAKAVAKPVPVRIVSDKSKSSSPSYVEEDKKWRIERDVRTLQEAAEIKADKNRMKEAKACVEKQVKALKSIK